MKKVAGIHELNHLAENGRAIVVPSYSGFETPKPAAWVIHMPGVKILDFIKRGMFIYKKGASDGR